MEKCLKAENGKLSAKIINDITSMINIVHKINCLFLMLYLHIFSFLQYRRVWRGISPLSNSKTSFVTWS